MSTTRTPTDMIPPLDTGLTLLETASARSHALHAIALAHHTITDRQTFWIDSRANASTYRLNDLAPSDRSLTGLRIARAFTAYQHYSLVKHVAHHITPDTELIVVPCIAALYRDDDLPEYRRTQFIESTSSLLHELATARTIPILVTDPGPPDTLTATLHDSVDHEITCRNTDLGIRFETEGFETTIYWSDGFWQTTIPYWIDLLGTTDRPHHYAPTTTDLGSYLAA